MHTSTLNTSWSHIMMSLYLIYSGKVMKASRSKMVVGDGEGEVEFVLRLMDIPSMHSIM